MPDQPDQPATERPKKDDLAARAIDLGVPSYEAWDMTVPDLTKFLAKNDPEA